MVWLEAASSPVGAAVREGGLSLSRSPSPETLRCGPVPGHELVLPCSSLTLAQPFPRLAISSSRGPALGSCGRSWSLIIVTLQMLLFTSSQFALHLGFILPSRLDAGLLVFSDSIYAQFSSVQCVETATRPSLPVHAPHLGDPAPTIPLCGACSAHSCAHARIHTHSHVPLLLACLTEVQCAC